MRGAWVYLTLVLISQVYARTANLCLATQNSQGQTITYKPLQLYPSDCPGQTDCMSYVYNYSAPAFMYKGPNSLKPTATGSVREALAYLTQDENDNLDLVFITASTYTNNIINALVSVTGATPASILVKDDPTEDTWEWNDNKGNFSWLLQPSFTDGFVVGHFNIIDNFCVDLQLIPNWNNAITSVVFLSGTKDAPTRVISKPVQARFAAPVTFTFCQYPKAVISKTDKTCSTQGSATATALEGSNPTYEWENSVGTTIATTSTVSNLDAGNYFVTVTAGGCSVKRPVTIVDNSGSLDLSGVVTSATQSQPGKVVLTVSGGTPPYTITWYNSNNVQVGTGATLNAVGGIYTAVVTDGCLTASEDFTIGVPDACNPGSFYNADSDSCETCPAGTYSDSFDALRCTVCPPGHWNNVAGSTSCAECGANTVSDGYTQSCTTCPRNTVSDAGSAVCRPCPPGTDRDTNSGACSVCPPGSSRCDDSDLCTPCPAGTFENNSVCELCAPGTAKSTSGEGSCTPCPTGTYAAAGATACTSCPTGKTSPAGSSVLLACV